MQTPPLDPDVADTGRGHIAASLVLLGLSGKHLCYLATQPQPEIGRTVPYVAEGVEVYITPDDQQLNSELKWTIIGSGTILMVGVIFSGEFRFS